MTARPLAVVMVADPTPLTLTNLRQLSTWCDLLLTEGTTTTMGAPRTPLRQGWRDLLGLEPPELMVLTTDLAGANEWARHAVQRNSAMAVISQLPDDRAVLMVDSDEFLNPEPILEAITTIEKPHRLPLNPLYGAIDRVALRIHCCWKPEWPDLRDAQPPKPYRFAGPSIATAAMMRHTLPSPTRFRSPVLKSDADFGTHVTMTNAASEVSWKLNNTLHVWHPRVLDERHLATMLDAGVHHAGWWVANYREPEPWLRDLARIAGLRECGPLHPTGHLRALRAWSEARLDPRIPDSVVGAMDEYVSTRPADAEDFLNDLDEWQLQRPVTHNGHMETDTSDDHPEC